MSALRTRVMRIDPKQPDPAAISEAAAVLRRGGLVAFPTETVYGLGAAGLDPVAVARIFLAKGRPPSSPLILHVVDVAQARSLVSAMPEAALRLAARFWPGPLTLVLPRGPAVPDAVAAGGPTVGIRAPDHRVAQDLIAAAGMPIAAPSANLSGRPSPTTAAHVLSDLDGRVDVILDAGPSALGVPSTVLDLTASPPRILRSGAISAAALREVVGEVAPAPATDRAPASRASGPGPRQDGPRPRRLLFVCSGNTCRSPMAAALAGHCAGHLAGRPAAAAPPGAAPAVEVASAGLSAFPGEPPSAHAVAAMGERGIDLGGHRARRLDADLVAWADLILTMTADHRRAVTHLFPGAAGCTFTLVEYAGGSSKADVPDPIGGPLDDYRRCADALAGHVARAVERLAGKTPEPPGD